MGRVAFLKIAMVKTDHLCLVAGYFGSPRDMTILEEGILSYLLSSGVSISSCTFLRGIGQ